MSNSMRRDEATTKGNAKIVYMLYLVGLVFGITGIIGVVMAYVNHDESPDWLKSHYRFQIRTFWIGLLLMFLGSILSIILIGWFIFLFWIVWLVIRCIKGMKNLELEKPVDDPASWLF